MPAKEKRERGESRERERETARGQGKVSVRSEMNQHLSGESISALADCGCICARLKIKKWQSLA